MNGLAPGAHWQRDELLCEAGFDETETHFKWAEAAVFGGVRPTGGS